MFGIGIKNAKFPQNMGTLFRSAQAFEANYVFTIGKRYQRERTDTTDVTNSVTYYPCETLDELLKKLPRKTILIGLELYPNAKELPAFTHPPVACYLLGAEDQGLSRNEIEACHHVVQIPACRVLNVAVVASIVLYDRSMKLK